MAKNKNKKIRRTASNIILFCLIVIAIVSAYKVFTILCKYNADKSAYDEINKLGNAEKFTGDIDFEALREKNPDVIAWIYLKDSKINYPIVKAPNNDKYLYTLFNGEYGEAGTIFTDAATKSPFKQFNTIVYGHHRKDGTMFNNLKEFKDKDYYETHKQFELILPDGKYHLKVYAFLNVNSTCEIYTNNLSSESEKQAYLDWIDKNADYLTGIKADTSDKLVALSTCAYEFENARYIVVGKMVPWKKQ